MSEVHKTGKQMKLFYLNLKKSWILILLFSLNSCGHFTQDDGSKGSNKAPSTITLDYTWAGIGRCLGSSPEIFLSGVPEQTHTLNFKLKDIFFPFFPHGGGELSYIGNKHILQGEIKKAKSHFIGPCAPPFFPGQYEISVIAFDKNGTPLAEGKSRRPFPHR